VSHRVGLSVPAPTVCPGAVSHVVARRLDGRGTAWRCLGQGFRIINPKPTASTYGDLSGRRNLHRWRGIAHLRREHARCPVNSSCDALKARPQWQCSSRNIAAQCRVFLVDASKPGGLVMTTTIRCWRRGGCHHGHEHGNHEDDRETSHWFCHGAVRSNFQVPVYSMPKPDSSLARTCLLNGVGPGLPIPGAFEPSGDGSGQPGYSRVYRLVGVFA